MANPLSPAPKKSGRTRSSRALGGGNAAQDPKKSKIVVPKTASPETGLGGGRKKRFFARLMGLGESKIQRPNGARQAEPQERTGEQAGSGQLQSVAWVPGVQDGVTGTDCEQLVKEGQLESSKTVTPADEEERHNVEIVKEGERQKVKIATEADNGSSQKATPANEEEKQSLKVLEHESQEYGSRSTTNVDTEASGSTDGSRGQPAGYDPWAALKLSIEKKAAANEIETLKKRNKELEEQIARAESQNSRAHSAHGVYSRSEADPGLLQTVATAIKLSLTSFTDILTERMKSEPGLKADFHPTGVKFKRGVDIKFAIQAELCSLVFQGLWDTDEYFFYRCLPEYADLEKSKKAHFTRYKDFKALEASGAVNKRLNGSECDQAKCKDACSCGLMEFMAFFNAKCEGLMQSKLGKLTPGNGSLREDFLGLLTNVWLAHLLTLSFEQPATLFKVRGGQKFVKDHMDPAMEAEETMAGTVAFMIIPGFRVGKSLIKSMVYLGSPAS